MQLARIPLTILVALELGTAACTSTTNQPCLKVADPHDPNDPPLGACLEVAPHPCLTPVAPCLDVPPPPEDPKDDPEPPEVGPCLEVPPPTKPDVEIGPCLKVAPPEPPEPDEPRVGPCLRIAPKRPRKGAAEVEPTPPPDPGAGMARADILDRLAETLPPDVLAKLRRRT